MSVVPSVFRPPRLIRQRSAGPFLPARYRLFVLLALVAFVSAISLVLMNDDYRAVLGPPLACVHLALFFVAVLYWRDGVLPVFESGTLWVAATTIYSVFPMVNLALGGMRWVSPADYRLVAWDPSPQEMGAFAMNHVLYLATFVVVYLVIRGRKVAPHGIAPIPYPLRLSIILTLTITMILMAMIRFVVLPPEASISAYEGGNFAYRANVPHFFLQIINIGGNGLLVMKLFFAIVLLSRWRDRKWRFVLYLWLPLELAMTFRGLSRGPLVVLILSMGILYHRLVRPFSLKTAAIFGTCVVAGFLAFGFFRDLGRLGIATTMIANNEFQGLFANAFDIYTKKRIGVLQTPPAYLGWSDLYMLVPSQFLPFYKWEPNEWYAEILGIRETGLRTMWGVMAQSMLGGGTTEVFFRGLAIAVVLALLHRWYVKRSERFWRTALYAYVCVWTFYTFRSTTFSPLYMVVYYWCTAALLVIAVKVAIAGNLRRFRRR